MLHATFGSATAGSEGPTPDRPASRWYSVHSAEIGGDGVGVVRGRDATVESEPELQAAATRHTATNRRIKGPRQTCGRDSNALARARSTRPGPAWPRHVLDPSRRRPSPPAVPP